MDCALIEGFVEFIGHFLKAVCGEFFAVGTDEENIDAPFSEGKFIGTGCWFAEPFVSAVSLWHENDAVLEVRHT